MTSHDDIFDSTVSGELLLFRTMWNNSSDNMFIVRLEDGEFINESCNRAQEETFGLSPHQVDEVNLKDILDNHTYELVIARYKKCIALNKPVTYEESTVINNKQRYWNTTILPVKDDNNTKIFGISREISELKNLTQELEHLNENLELKVEEKTKDTETLLSLFDKGETVLFRWNNDEHWSVDYVSKSVEKLLGYSIDEFMSNKVQYEQCIYKDDLANVIEEVKSNSNLQVDYFKHEPYRVVTKCGRIIYILDYTVIIRNDKNEITHYLGYITDITKDIENERLKKDQEKLILEHIKNTQMAEMIENISHQWRQPLSIISTAASGIKIKKEIGISDDTLEIEMLEKICEATQYLSNTIDIFSEYVKEKKEYKEVVLQDRLNMAIGIVKASLDNENIKFISNIEQFKPIHIKMVVGEFSDILINIINNAREALVNSKTKSPFIELKLDKKDDFVSISVEDNGGGIKEENLHKIFDPYFTTKHKSQGKGLGLHMSKKIIEDNLNGSLSVQNGKAGAIFNIILPLNA